MGPCAWASIRRAAVLGVVLAALAACVPTPAAQDPGLASAGKGPAPRLSGVTVLPSSFAKGLPHESSARVTVPPNMMMVSLVARPKAVLRNGPGPQFDLADALLPQGTPLLLFSRVGVWQKVVVVGTWQRGWVHAGALGPTTPNQHPLVVDMRRLPTVIAAHDVDSAQAFRTLRPLKVAIPRGAQFRSLRIADGGTLIWLPQTNSTMWLPRKDVQ